jgi:CBS domain-containing membrane protein
MAVVGGPTVTGAGYGFAFSPILVTSLLLLTIAWLFNFATRQHNWHRSAGKLAELPEEALTSHIQNHGAIRCHDVMSHEPSVIDIACDLDAAWVSLRSRGVLSLPVVDKRTGHFVGLITVEDCVKRYKSIAPDQSRFDQRCTAAALVRTGVNPVTADTSVIDLVQALSEYGPYPVPVVDAAGRLIGTVTHSDLTTAILFANYVANYEKAGTT